MDVPTHRSVTASIVRAISLRFRHLLAVPTELCGLTIGEQQLTLAGTPSAAEYSVVSRRLTTNYSRHSYTASTSAGAQQRCAPGDKPTMVIYVQAC